MPSCRWQVDCRYEPNWKQCQQWHRAISIVRVIPRRAGGGLLRSERYFQGSHCGGGEGVQKSRSAQRKPWKLDGWQQLRTRSSSAMESFPGRSRGRRREARCGGNGSEDASHDVEMEARTAIIACRSSTAISRNSSSRPSVIDVSLS